MDLSSFVCLPLIFYALGVVELCGAAAAASRSARQQQSGQDYYQNYDSQHYSYSQVQDYDQPAAVEDTKCYVCEYSFTASDNHHEGLRQCMDPFDGKDVPEVECDAPCVKEYEKKGQHSYKFRRGCLHNCKEKKSEDGSYKLCCTGHLCNGSFSSSYVVKDQRWLLTVGCLVSIVASLLRLV